MPVHFSLEVSTGEPGYSEQNAFLRHDLASRNSTTYQWEWEWKALWPTNLFKE
jgi:hypothetical protein